MEVGLQCAADWRAKAWAKTSPLPPFSPEGKTSAVPHAKLVSPPTACAFATVNCFRSPLMISCALPSMTKHFALNCMPHSWFRSVTPRCGSAMDSRIATARSSYGVVVGDLKLSVSERIALRRMPATPCGIATPWERKWYTRIVQHDPQGRMSVNTAHAYTKSERKGREGNEANDQIKRKKQTRSKKIMAGARGRAARQDQRKGRANGSPNVLSPLSSTAVRGGR